MLLRAGKTAGQYENFCLCVLLLTNQSLAVASWCGHVDTSICYGAFILDFSLSLWEVAGCSSRSNM